LKVPEISYLAKHPILRKALVPVTAVVFFVLFLVLTFPYDTLALRLTAEAQREGAELTIGSLGPAGLGGLRARDVKLRLPPSPNGEPSTEVKLERADLSPDILPLILRRTSFGFSVEGYGGTVKGHLALSNDPKLPGLTSLRIDARDVDLATLPLAEMTSGLTVGGKMQLKMDLKSLQPVETASGDVQVNLDNVAITGSMMGMTLPKTMLGKLEGGATVEKGVARLDKTNTRGGDIDADVDGNVSLRPLFSLSQADLHVRFRPADHWLDQNPAIKGMMGLLQNARQPDGAYLYSMNGPVSRLQPRPGK
jgi:type II secretion system protein N